MKTSVIAIVVVVIVVIIAGAAFLALSGGSGTTTSSTTTTPVVTTSTTPISTTSTVSTTTSTSSSSSTQATGSADLAAVQSANTAHINAIQQRNVPLVLGGYTNNAVVVWTGNTGGLGGTYTGTGNIRLLYAGALSTAQTITLTMSNYTASAIDSTHANSTYNLAMNGTSSVLGAFHGHIAVSVAWIYNGTAWAIQQENWNYVTFATSVSGGATTFPQWHTPSRDSPDALKNFIFHIGGGAFAFAIFAYMAVIGVLLVVFAYRRYSAARLP
ncbi:MAG: hypothetical protein ACHQ1H_01770 [Nitrososphaerales archaeon]